MFLQVGIDPDAGAEIAQGAVDAPGPSLVRKLRECGLLALHSNDAVAELMSAFPPGELQTFIFEMIKAGRVITDSTASPIPLRDLYTAEDVASWRTLAALLLLAQMRISELPRGLSRPEVSTLREAHNSTAFDDVDRLRSRSLPVGTHRDQVWRDHFGPFAERAQRVYIIDRHLGHSLADALHRSNHATKKQGPEWLLTKLSRSRVRTIRVASSSSNFARGGADAATERIQAWFTSLKSDSKLTLHFVAGSFEHARGIAFDGWAAFDPHNGAATFDQPRLPEPLLLTASLEHAKEISTAFKKLSARAG